MLGPYWLHYILLLVGLCYALWKAVCHKLSCQVLLHYNLLPVERVLACVLMLLRVAQVNAVMSAKCAGWEWFAGRHTWV